jgi:tetratricopeptide (TPR) repeat protein
MTSGRPRPQVFNYLASLYMAQGQGDLALSTVGNGLELYPENTDLLYQKALILERVGRHQEAAQEMKALLSFDDQHAEALNFLAYDLAVKNRDLDEALHYAERAIALKPEPHIMDTLGWVYYRMGRLIEALKIIEEASRELSEDAVIFEHLGEIHLSLRNLKQARTAFERSLQLAPDNDKLREKLETLADSL